jgi:hypothetical protein
MTKSAYFGYIFAIVVVVPVGALIAQFASRWLARFRPRYLRALVSTVVAYAIVNGAGWIASFFGSQSRSQRTFQVLAGLAALACSHRYFLRSDAGDRLSPGQAFLVALCQIVGATLVLLLVLLILLGVSRVFA